MSLICVSDYGFCAKEKYCFNHRYKAPKKDVDKYKNAWCKSHRLFMANWLGERRAVALVGVRRKGESKISAHFMDAITGSLFSARSLHLASSNHQLTHIERNQRESSIWLKSYVASFGQTGDSE